MTPQFPPTGAEVSPRAYESITSERPPRVLKRSMIPLAFTLLVAVSVGDAAIAAGCAKSAKELSKLRGEYRSYAANSKPAHFDELTRILDKIIQVKGEMRKANCKVPPRTQ